MSINIASDETHEYRPFCPPVTKVKPELPKPCVAITPTGLYPINLMPDFKIYCKERDYCFKIFGHNYKGKMLHSNAYSDSEIDNIYTNNMASQSLCILKCEGWNPNGYNK